MSAYVLENLILAGYNVIGIVSQPDKEKDRKGNLLETETKKVGKKYNIPVYQFDSLKENINDFKNISPELIITIAYGKIVPEDILNIPKYGSINLHGSILPKLRGAAPIQYALFLGLKETGFTLMKMVKKMDAGDMYAKKIVTISNDDNYTSLEEKMEKCASDLLLENIDKYLSNELIPVKQNEYEATFTSKITKEDEKLSLDLKMNDFLNKIRGLSLVPGGFLYFNDKKFKILQAKKLNNEQKYQVGSLFVEPKNKLCLQLLDGSIILLKVQLEGKKIMDGSSFLNGNHISNIVLK